jgi:hypothetical protein
MHEIMIALVDTPDEVPDYLYGVGTGRTFG